MRPTPRAAYQHRSRFAVTIASLAGIALLASACTKADPQEVTEFANLSIRTNLVGLAGAASVVERSEAPWAVAGWIEGGEVVAKSGNPQGEMAAELEAMADEIAGWLATHVFNDENVESVQRGKVTYLLEPSSVCKYEDWDGTTRTDTDCVQMLTSLPVRFVASWGRDDQLQVEVHVGELPLRPLDLELHTDFVSLTPDLGEVVRLAEAVADEVGEDLGIDFTLAGKVGMALQKEGEGAYSVTYSVVEKVLFAMGARADHDHVRIELAPADVAFRALFSQDDATVSLGLSTIDVAVARDLLMGDPGTWVCPDDQHCWSCGDEQSGGECYWVCEDFDYECEYVEPETRLSGVFDIHLGGLLGSMTMTTSDDSIDLTGLGLGNEASSVSFNGLPIFVLDVNEESGGQFDLTLSTSEGDLFLGVSPSMNIRLGHDLSSLLADHPDIPAWLLGGFTSLALDDALAPVLRIFQFSRSGDCPWVCETGDPCWSCDEYGWCDWVCDPDLCWDCDANGDCVYTCQEPCDYVCSTDETTGPSGLLQVVQGTLTLNASAIDAPIEVGAGQCLIELDVPEYTAEDHPFVMLGDSVCE